MRINKLLIEFVFLAAIFFSVSAIFAQKGATPPTVTEVIMVEEIPPIIKHLPDWKNVRDRAVYITSKEDLQESLGGRPGFDLISFEGGTEAVTASYDDGKLLIVEYTTPQFSIDADNRVKQYFETNQSSPPTYFKRVGNYEVFVFDAADETAARDLIDQVKYEKTVQWLGKDPYLYQKAERAYLKMTSEVFISSFISIALGIGFAVSSGIGLGFLIFYLRKQKRDAMRSFSDAGGMVRLNLDELTSDFSTDRLLKD